jgi:hypothetical protein
LRNAGKELLSTMPSFGGHVAKFSVGKMGMNKRTTSPTWKHFALLCIITSSVTFSAEEKIAIEPLNGVLVTDEKPRIFFSGLQDLKLTIRLPQASDFVNVDSKFLPKLKDAALKIENGAAVVTLDYRNLELHEPDVLIVRCGAGKVVLRETKVDVYPLRVKFKSHLPKAQFTFVIIPTEGQRESSAKFAYSITPWHQDLKKYISFIVVPAMFCKSTCKLSASSPIDDEDELTVSVEADSPGMAAITSLINNDKLQECSERFPLYIKFDKLLRINTVAATDREREMIDQVFSEVYPRPLNQEEKDAIEKIKTVLKDHYVPNIDKVLRSFDKKVLSEVLRSASQPWEKIVLAFAEFSIKFANIPPDVDQNAKTK